ncbi:unnamed protein product [Phaedon cochleariae]|uniref:Uncharacterized protein n=1 Tax=Phaedon cochleariae TaxID=80249 RepID=A0A9N9X3T9_PHACE|nr:unnamed protein product [Phaedon cochleariae]
MNSMGQEHIHPIAPRFSNIRFCEHSDLPWMEIRPPQQESDISSAKAEGESYAELLRSVKDRVNFGSIGENISKIRKSQKGDLVLTVEGGKGMAETLRGEIANKLQSAVMMARANCTTSFVNGIDAAATSQEVIEAIKKETEEKLQNIEMKAMKSGLFGSQTAALNRNSGYTDPERLSKNRMDQLQS